MKRVFRQYRFTCFDENYEGACKKALDEAIKFATMELQRAETVQFHVVSAHSVTAPRATVFVTWVEHHIE